MKFTYSTATLIALATTLAACQRIAHDRTAPKEQTTVVTTSRAAPKDGPTYKYKAVLADGTCSRALRNDLGLEKKWRHKKIDVIRQQFKALYKEETSVLREALAREITISHADLAKMVREFRENFGPFECTHPETGEAESSEALDADFNAWTKHVLDLPKTVAARNDEYAKKQKELETKTSQEEIHVYP